MTRETEGWVCGRGSLYFVVYLIVEEGFFNSFLHRRSIGDEKAEVFIENISQIFVCLFFDFFELFIHSLKCLFIHI